MTTQTDTTVEDVKSTRPILTGPTNQQGITEIFANQKEKSFSRQFFNYKILNSRPGKFVAQKRIKLY